MDEATGLNSVEAEKASTHTTEDGPPDGGLQAWMTVIGGWLFYFCGLG
jgi:hypothetical protein